MLDVRGLLPTFKAKNIYDDRIRSCIFADGNHEPKKVISDLNIRNRVRKLFWRLFRDGARKYQGSGWRRISVGHFSV